MTAANVLKDPAFGREDDAKLCVDYMRPHVQALVDCASAKYKSGKGALWALHWGFADLLCQFDDDRTALENIVSTYATMQRDERDAAQDCQKRVKQMLIGARLKGFSLTAMAWAMLGALSNWTCPGFVEC
jgi:hypothetical protein